VGWGEPSFSAQGEAKELRARVALLESILRKRRWNLGLTKTEAAAEQAICDTWPRPYRP